MTKGENQGATTPVDLADPTVIEALLRYDELEAQEIARLRSDVSAGAVLEHLELADRYLAQASGRRASGTLAVASGTLAAASGTGESVAVMDAVTPEDLYDFGGGPGASPLDESRRDSIAQHIAAHPIERGFVETLRETPPSPLLDTGLLDTGLLDTGLSDAGLSDAGGHPDAVDATPSEEALTDRPIPSLAVAREKAAQGTRRSAPAWLAWTPMAAAALVLAMALGGGERRSVLAGALPESPILRSAPEGRLLFPRGRVLPSTESETSYAARPIFEVTPIEGAEAYLFSLRKFEGDAFENGKEIWTSRSIDPNGTAMALGAGEYEWTASAIINGLERSLGAQSFQVMSAPETVTPHASSISGDPISVRASIRRLHASGFLTDARHYARSLPPSDERDAYLATSK